MREHTEPSHGGRIKDSDIGEVNIAHAARHERWALEGVE